jgi:hypothetical protein
MTKVAVSALLALVCLALFASSAQAVQIMAETGAALPPSITVGESLTVLITDDAGTPIDGVAKSARVRYRLDSGTRIPVEVGSDGKTVNPYTSPYSGVLNITVSYGTAVIASQTMNVIAAAAPTSTPTYYRPSGGGGGGGYYYPPATPTPTVTATATPTAPPGATPKVTPVATPVEVKTSAPTPKPPKTEIPGFTSVSLISGLLAALYLVLRRRE